MEPVLGEAGTEKGVADQVGPRLGTADEDVALGDVRHPVAQGRDVEIAQYALPILMKETTTQQSAQIDMVSGATYTSEGYLQSLQSALDQANL